MRKFQPSRQFTIIELLRRVGRGLRRIDRGLSLFMAILLSLALILRDFSDLLQALGLTS